MAGPGVGLAPHGHIARDDLGRPRFGDLRHGLGPFRRPPRPTWRCSALPPGKGQAGSRGRLSPDGRPQNRAMGPFLSIGDFSRATHLTVKTLRHYHDVGLLEPADVDPATGYRRYTTGQIPAAQVIRRFRELGMPLEEIRTVMTAPDLDTRNRHIAAHLDRLEAELGRTQRAVASLRDLLAPGESRTPRRTSRCVRRPRCPRRRSPRPSRWRTAPRGCRARWASCTPPWRARAWRRPGRPAGCSPTPCSPSTTARRPSSSPAKARCAARPGPARRGPGRRTGGHRARRAAPARPGLRRAGGLRRAPRAGGAGSDPRVLPRRAAGHRRCGTLADRGVLAGVPDEQRMTGNRRRSR